MKMTTTDSSSPKTEEHHVSGDQLLNKIKEIIRQGNARRITIRNEAGKVLMEVPLSLGIVGVVFAPVWVAIGTVAALAGKHTVVVERRD